MKLETPASRAINAHIAAEHRKTTPDFERVAALRRQLREEQLAEHIRRVVDEAPPLTGEQRARLAALLSNAEPANSAA